MGRVKHTHNSTSLVIVRIIDNISVAVFKSKGHSPVGLYGNSPKIGPVTFQSMQPHGWGIQIAKLLGIVQQCQNQAQPFGVNCLNTGLIARGKELFQSFVRELLIMVGL
jgi:hypothetical protein